MEPALFQLRVLAVCVPLFPPCFVSNPRLLILKSLGGGGGVNVDGHYAPPVFSCANPKNKKYSGFGPLGGKCISTVLDQNHIKLPCLKSAANGTWFRMCGGIDNEVPAGIRNCTTTKSATYGFEEPTSSQCKQKRLAPRLQIKEYCARS